MYFKEAFEKASIGGKIRHQDGSGLEVNKLKHATVGSAAAVMMQFSNFTPASNAPKYDILLSDKWEVVKEKKSATFHINLDGSIDTLDYKLMFTPGATITVEWSE